MKKYFLILIIISNYIFAIELPYPQDIFLKYKFTGNLLDSSLSGFHALKNKNAIFVKDRFGNDNSAIYFNGIDAYVDLPDSLYLPSILELTLCFWFKNEQDNSHQAQMFYIGSSTGEIQSGVFYDILFGGAKLTDSQWRNVRQTDTVDCITKWHYYTLTYKRGDFINLYIDANLKESLKIEALDLISYKKDPNKAFPCLGAYSIGRKTYSQIWHGTLDDVLIYHRILTQEDIQKIMLIPETYNSEKIKTNITLPDTTVRASNDDFIIPIEILNSGVLPFKNIHFKIKIAVSKYAFYPKDNTFLSYIEGDTRFIELQGILNLDAKEKIILNEIKGFVIASIKYSDIKVVEFTLDDECYQTPELKNGSINIQACVNLLNRYQIIKSNVILISDLLGNIVIKQKHNGQDINQLLKELPDGLYSVRNELNYLGVVNVLNGDIYFGK